ncbi:MAG: sortase [Patescibacteria group bacterium]
MNKIFPGKIEKKREIFQTLVFGLKILNIALLLYLIVYPFYPQIKYRFFGAKDKESQDISQVNAAVKTIINKLPASEFSISPDRLIIPKIGVNAPIILSDNEKTGLSKGAWLVPFGSTPDKGGNTIITGHRFKYLPPNNTTFYLFDKLKTGDIFSILWQGRQYNYRVRQTMIIDPSNSSPYNISPKAIVTLYTCDPIYSTKNRLVIVSDLINIDETMEK